MAAVSLLTQARLMSVHSLDWILKEVYRGIRKCYVPQLESLLLIPHSVYYLNRSIPSICCCTAWKQVLYPRIEFWFLPCKRKWLWQNLSLCMPHYPHSWVLLLFLKRKQCSWGSVNTCFPSYYTSQHNCYETFICPVNLPDYSCKLVRPIRSNKGLAIWTSVSVMIFLRCRSIWLIFSSVDKTKSLCKFYFYWRNTTVSLQTYPFNWFFKKIRCCLLRTGLNWLNFPSNKRKMHVLDSFVDPLTCRITPAPSLQSVQRSYGRAGADVIFNNLELFLMSN